MKKGIGCRLFSGAGGLAIAMLLAGTARAQQAPTQSAPPANTDESNEIIVTATKRAQRLQDVPASIVAETGEELARRGATQLQDVIDNTPGVNNPAAGARSISNITIRGVTTGTNVGFTQNTVAQLYDDITIDPIASAGTTNLRLVDIERVEVLRGPQGTLFGSGSLAGAIRYVTRKPDLKSISGSAEGSVSGVRSGDVGGYGTATLNIPIVTDRLAIRATGYGYRDAGWIDNLRTGQANANYSEAYGGRATLRWVPTDRLTTDVTVLHQQTLDNAPSASLFDGPTDDQIANGPENPRYRTRTTIVGVNLQYRFDGATLTSQSSYHDRGWRQEGANFWYLPLTTGILSQFGNIVNGPASDNRRSDAQIFTQEIRLASSGNGPFKWTIGGFYLDASFAGPQQVRAAGLVPIAGSDNIVDVALNGSQREIAGFGEVSYTIGGRLDLAAGVRVSDVTIRNTVISGGFLPVFSFSPAAYQRQDFREQNTPVTPHFSITYRPSRNLSLYAAAARGFRVGGVNVTAGVGGRAIPPTYSPDNLWNYEIGAKGRLLDGAIDYALSFYYIDWQNIQVSLQNNVGQYTGNAGSANLYGVEFQGVARPSRYLTLGAGFNIASNRLASNVNGLVTAIGVVNVRPGDLIAASSEAQANAFGEYRAPLGRGQGYIRASGRYVGPAYTGFNRAGTRFGDYALADLRLGYDTGPYELVVFVNNLFDSTGAIAASDAATIGPIVQSTRNAFRVQPRTIGLTGRVRF